MTQAAFVRQIRAGTLNQAKLSEVESGKLIPSAGWIFAAGFWHKDEFLICYSIGKALLDVVGGVIDLGGILFGGKNQADRPAIHGGD